MLTLSLIFTAMFGSPLMAYAADNTHTPYSGRAFYRVDNVDYFDVYGTSARDNVGGSSAFLRQVLTGNTSLHPSITRPQGGLAGSTLTNWNAIARYIYNARANKITGALGDGKGTQETRTVGYSEMLALGNDKLNIYDTPTGSGLVGNTKVNWKRIGSVGLQQSPSMAEAEKSIRNEVASAGEIDNADIKSFVSRTENTALKNTNSSSPVFFDTSLLKFYHTANGSEKNPDVVLGTANVFYDFKLHYLNTPDARSALSESSEIIGNQEIKTPELSYSPMASSSSPKHVAAAENATSLPVEMSQSISSSTETTVENSWEKSKEIGFEEMIGGETTVEAGVIFAKATQAFKLEFKASQAFTSTEGSSTSNTTTSERSNDITVPLPPYTALMLEQSESNASLTTKYDYPVAVTYKVKVCAIVAECRGIDTFINTTIANFGRNVNEHTSAIDNLKQRVETYTGGFEKTYGDDLPDDVIHGLNSTSGSGNVIGNYYNSLINLRPMSVTGADMTVNAKSVNSKVYGVSPISPLNKISLDKVETLKMTEDDELYVDNITLNAYNTAGAPYYGFHESKGEWELVDEDGNPYTGDLVSLKTDKITGYKTLTANKGNGTVYLKYVIDDNTYTSADQIELYGIDSNLHYTKNADLAQTAALKINVADKVRDIRVSAKGELTGYVDDDPINLEDSDLDVRVYENDMIQDFPIEWEAQDQRATAGIKIEANRLSFTKPGEYNIRAKYNNQASDWITVKALPASEHPKNKPAVVPQTEPKAPEKTNMATTSVDTIKNKTYTGKAIQPEPVVTLNGATLVKGTDYTVAYQDNKEIGTATITITGMGKYEGTKVVNFKIVPKKPSISNKAGSGKIKVKWKKVPKSHKITKYQVRYKVKGAKKWIVKDVSAKKNSVTLKKLKKGKTYKIQVRSYKKVGKTTYHSAWSKTMSKKCK